MVGRVIGTCSVGEFHLANIYAKLQVSSRSQLAARHDVLGTLGAAETDKA